MQSVYYSWVRADRLCFTPYDEAMGSGSDPLAFLPPPWRLRTNARDTHSVFVSIMHSYSTWNSEVGLRNEMNLVQGRKSIYQLFLKLIEFYLDMHKVYLSNFKTNLINIQWSIIIYMVTEMWISQSLISYLCERRNIILYLNHSKMSTNDYFNEHVACLEAQLLFWAPHRKLSGKLIHFGDEWGSPLKMTSHAISARASTTDGR